MHLGVSFVGKNTEGKDVTSAFEEAYPALPRAPITSVYALLEHKSFAPPQQSNPQENKTIRYVYEPLKI